MFRLSTFLYIHFLDQFLDNNKLELYNYITLGDLK